MTGGAKQGTTCWPKPRSPSRDCRITSRCWLGRSKTSKTRTRARWGRTTADQIDGEIDALENEVRRLVREHDRKIVLAYTIREADRRFREEHQPDVIRRASGYFATITADRYDRVMVDDSGEFHVRGSFDNGTVSTVAAESLSTGAREQLYLAMRLAIMSHLDHDRERLPVFIDEALVNWDAARRTRGFQLLRELSQTRQVFVMTCHERWAQELTDAGANRIDLT